MDPPSLTEHTNRGLGLNAYTNDGAWNMDWEDG
jgi:hypothetical protein